MRVLLGIVAICLIGLITFSFAGALHPAGDSFAVVRIPMIVALLLVALFGARGWAFRGIIVVCAVLLADRALLASGQDVSDPDVVIYQKNLLYLDYDHSDLLQDILASGARVITLQEVSADHDDLLDALKDTHPHQFMCRGVFLGGVAVLSTDPIVKRDCYDRSRLAVAEISVQDSDVRMRAVSVHLYWPWPKTQARALDRTLPDLEGLEAMPTILGGDFNMVPWGHALDRVADAFDVVRVGHVERTYEVFGWPLTIDHVLAGPNAMGSIDVRDRMGSDHFGIIGRVVFNAP
ncbi:endonuclease/exonuclease/phosphatase family protein [Octadecabacter sp. G9-8]|uniref:Endonuclease/exonuclease/phosphatase family protein n=1 Tax=Octadecabacter dasysiphoniae TaxID=2909341 RepID=A0ABS9D1N3_9RHOB|nr:endonuclease/exonuclease/phosphatase family protein [Octadecabacter dasysiphoniae]MCF2872208.1 endonuclease/exonuclease/phosphatase family protein [Octadecabacter dasysiphoniae]